MAQSQLTSKSKVKSLLGISGSSYDTILDSLVNGVSSFIESFCARIFLTAIYTEYYDGEDGGKIYFNQAPVTALTSFEYNSGTPANPIWVAFDANNYVLSTRDNCIALMGGIPRGYQNIKIVYVAGYKIDWANENTPALHNLPFDLAMVADQLVSKAFGARKSEGLSSESIDGANVSYSKGMTDDQKMILSKYRQIII